ncbi:MAG: DUF418 domain-containing protein [Phycisphaerales bacterium JB060]
MASTSTTDPGPLGPTTRWDRIDAIDTLRGVALLGIFVMNVPIFALTGTAFFNPPVAGGFEGLDYLTWLFSHLLFDMKMMAIFSMLFGAGVALMADRLTKTGRSAAGVHYMRMVWLLVIGMLHAYLIWFGDILVAYALTGMLVYPMRRVPAVWLVVISGGLLAVGMTLTGLQQAFFEMMRTSTDPDMAEAWQDMGTMFFPTEAFLEEERAKNLDGFFGRARAYMIDVVFMQTYVFGTFIFWRVAALMLLGMALHKWGVFRADRSARFYATLTAIGALTGGGLVAAGVVVNHANGFDPVAFFGVVGWFNYAGSVGMALAWIGLVMLVCKTGVLGLVRHALASVGRMALTNYLMQSLIGAFIFYGWGLGYFGQLSRSELLPIVLGVWTLQLIISTVWLWKFRFGPMEWVWRSLTYLKPAPMLKAARAGTAAG